LPRSFDGVTGTDAAVRVLLTGAEGFLGQAIADALSCRGHRVLRGVRRPPPSIATPGVIPVDFTRDFAAETWMPRLQGIDAVVNAVGIFRETPGATFDDIHGSAPRALFEACLMAGVHRIVQVSALGADDGARSAFHRSKLATDEALLSLPLSAAVVQPSLVYGEQGDSAAAFLTLASLPLIPLPNGGRQRVQPVHVDDVAEGVAALVDSETTGRVAFVGPRALTLREYLSILRRGLGLGRALFVPVPAIAIAVAGRLRMLPRLADRDALDMLERGNVADSRPLTRLLGRTPRSFEAFIPPERAAALARAARIPWLVAALRHSIAAMWIVTGLLSLGLYPVEQSYALLAQVGISPPWAAVVLAFAALLDIAMGIATLLVRRRWLWTLQAALVVGYTAIITAWLPAFWLHPFGPVLKNLPLLAAMWLLHAMESR
jgi:uncharacterized protein YbjT (DUF2867 family)